MGFGSVRVRPTDLLTAGVALRQFEGNSLGFSSSAALVPRFIISMTCFETLLPSPTALRPAA